MYAKKIVFSAFTAPALGKFSILYRSAYVNNFSVASHLVFVHQAAEYQNRRAEEKRSEASRRQQQLT